MKIRPITHKMNLEKKKEEEEKARELFAPDLLLLAKLLLQN